MQKEILAFSVEKKMSDQAHMTVISTSTHSQKLMSHVLLVAGNTNVWF